MVYNEWVILKYACCVWTQSFILLMTTTFKMWLCTSSIKKENLAKISKWDYIKLKSSAQQMKPSTIWKVNLQKKKNVLVNHVSDKELIHKICKKPLTTQQQKLFQDKLNKHFPKEGIQMSNRYMKRCLTSLIIREMQVKAKMTCIRVTFINKKTSEDRDGDGEKRILLHCCWGCKLAQTLWKTICNFFEN